MQSPDTPCPVAPEGRVLAYDVARLFIGPLFQTPRGIDRVDLALARHIFSDDASAHLGILPTPWGVQAYEAATVRRWLAHLEALWAEQRDIGQDTSLQQLIFALRHCDRQGSGPTAPLGTQPQSSRARWGKVARIVRQFWSKEARSGQKAAQKVPQGAAYVNIGQLGLAVPHFHKWLADRPDITSFMMLHDAIPIEFPHLVPPGADRHHRRMIATAARYAHCLIFNSACTQRSVTRVMEELTAVRLPSLVRPLPLPAAFLNAKAPVPDLADMSYFLIISTIEPRKNHGLLIGIWGRLLAELGPDTPHLVIVGAPGFAADKIFTALKDRPDLRRRVHIVSGLSSPALAALALGAAGILCPSLCEGFGLPVLEGNALGVPTLASDIPAHREVGNASTVFLPSADADSWTRAIMATRQKPRPRRPIRPTALTEAQYCSDIVDRIGTFPNWLETEAAFRVSQI